MTLTVHTFCMVGCSAGGATCSVLLCVCVVGNTGTRKSEVPAYLCSVFSVLQCKEIAMALVENIVCCFWLRLQCSNSLFRPPNHPHDAKWQSSNITSKFYVLCCLHVPKEN